MEVANQRRLLRTLEQLTNRLKRTLARQPLSSFHVSSEMIVADPRSLEGRRAFLSCRPGSVLRGRMCGGSDRPQTLQQIESPRVKLLFNPVCCFYSAVQCPVGTYFSMEHRECVSCWRGSYQDREGQLECSPCPEGSSTAYLHSRSVSECKGKAPQTHFQRVPDSYLRRASTRTMQARHSLPERTGNL